MHAIRKQHRQKCRQRDGYTLPSRTDFDHVCQQKVLSNCISDSFYRELFMNPCLSGWNNGEEKHEYMHLCHQVLSRSQFNAVLKLREAGIITNNLVSLPNLSNISLANNGTHVSLGSLKLSSLLSDSSSGYTRHHEKYLGDLVVKIGTLQVRLYGFSSRKGAWFSAARVGLYSSAHALAALAKKSRPQCIGISADTVRASPA